jgi:hypothetical protein
MVLALKAAGHHQAAFDATPALFGNCLTQGVHAEARSMANIASQSVYSNVTTEHKYQL